jgi:site-specific recombinase XerD
MTSFLNLLPYITIRPNPNRGALWTDTFEAWLTSHRSHHTRRAYRSSWDALLNFTPAHPWNITPDQIKRWIAHLTASNLSPSTIHQRLAAISSFYDYAFRKGLYARNPTHNIPRPKRPTYIRANRLSLDQSRGLLLAIPRHTRQGKRDYAFFVGLLTTGKTAQTLRRLRYGDLLTRQAEYPEILHTAITDFLASDGRLGSILMSDFIFTPISTRAAHLPNVQDWDPTHPISQGMLGRLLKKYTHLAGLDPTKITLQTLRYTSAHLHRQAGASIEKVAHILGHSDPALTDTLLRRIDTSTDSNWTKVSNLLGL